MDLHQTKVKFPTLLNLTFFASALLGLLFILSEYKVSQSESRSHENLQKLQSLQTTEHRIDNFLYPRPWKLIDLEVEYLINHPVCHNANETEPKEDLLMVVLVTSHIADFETRRNLRRIFPASELEKISSRRLFLLAQPNPAQLDSKYHITDMKQIIEESQIHKDILIGDFLESYKNLTYKHLMGLQWIDRYCSHAAFVVKQDDDIFVDLYQLSDVLKSNKSIYEKLTNQFSIWGKVLHHQPVIKDPKSKWFVSDTELNMRFYPPFVSGWGYVTTPKVVKLVVEEASNHKYFWIDDAFLTGIVRKKAIHLIDSSSVFTIYKGQMQCCVASSNQQDYGPFWCDYLVGPTNGDIQLLEILQNHARFCHTAHLCRRRSSRNSLNNKCVVTDKMIVNNYNRFRSVLNKTKNKLEGSFQIAKL